MKQEHYQDLVKRYHEPHRHYHDISHVQDLLQRGDFYSPIVLAYGPQWSHSILEHSIWYHDAIYNAKMNNNEEQSAQLFFVHNNKAILTKEEDTVHEFILATKNHQVPDTVLDKYRGLCGFFLSLDLLGFAEDESVVLANGKKIRKEYSHLTDEEWKGRTSFLETFLNRDPFYPHPFFENAMRDRTLRNIETEIDYWRNL